MPHYVTFQSDMDRLRTTQAKAHAAAAGDGGHDTQGDAK
jgi:alpha-D-ribose 1-methylphosphonate 5-triphosphate synthase subunit PhnI